MGMFIVRLVGSVAERLKAPVLKTGDPKGFQSSNLCASANIYKGLPKGSPFLFLGYEADSMAVIDCQRPASDLIVPLS